MVFNDLIIFIREIWRISVHWRCETNKRKLQKEKLNKMNQIQEPLLESIFD